MVLTGENGILSRASIATEEHKKAEYKEIVEMIIFEQKIEKNTKTEEQRPLIQMVAEEIEKQKWAEEVIMCDDNGDNSVEPSECTTIIIETTDGYEIKVNINNDDLIGEVEYVIKGIGEKYIVEFDVNGGEGKAPEEIEVKQGFFINELPTGENLIKTSYKLVGWSESSDGKNDKIYAPRSAYKPTKKTTTLYAIWAKDTIEISFDSNTGDGDMQSINPILGENIQLPNNIFTKYGYSFKEWNTSSDGTGTTYVNNETINVTEKTTLYAIWEEDITASLTVTNNKILESTAITLGGTAIANGIQQVELKVGNNVLYSESIDGSTSYNKADLNLSNLDQKALENLDFYEIDAVLYVTSTTGKVVSKTLKVRNFTIGNANSLNQFAQVVNGGNKLAGETVILIKDITVTLNAPIGYWNGVGESISLSLYFGGIFDGKNHYINVQGNNSKYASNGVFGAVYGGRIQNLTVKGSRPVGEKCIGLVGILESGSIYNCRNEATLNTSSGMCVGGICGLSISSTIERCCNVAPIYGSTQVGGIVGSLSGNSTMSLCYNTGVVNGRGLDLDRTIVGGLIGHIWRGGPINIVDCYNIGNISGIAGIGGLFGTNNGELCGTINFTNCYTTGTVSASENRLVGSLGGEMTKVNFNNCFTSCSTWNPYEAGCSYVNSATITATQLKEYASILGSSFKTDTSGTNGGFPILSWQ